MNSKALILVGAIGVFTPPAAGQLSNSDSTLGAAHRLYNAGSYESAELTARRLMELGPLADSIRIEAERIIAFSLVAEGKTDLARDHFESILAINPSLALDPVLTSPKILTVFQEARLHSETKRQGKTIVNKNDRRALSGVTFRTILFPGWEQYHQGRTDVGLVLGGAGVLTLGCALAFEILRVPARRDYLAATQPADISAKYNIYNRYYRGEVYSFVAFAAVYIASEFDVFINTDGSLDIQSAKDSVGGPGLVLSLRW